MQVQVFRMEPVVDGIPFDSTWDGPQTLVLAFFASEIALQSAPLERLRAAFPRSFLLGCSTVGEILGTGIEDHSIVVAVLRFASARLCMAQTDVTSGFINSGDAGAKLGRFLDAPDLKGIFVLSSGMDINGSELADGFSKVLPAGVKISGGLAADGEYFKETYILAAEPGSPMRLLPHHVGAVGFYGDSLHLGYGSHGGWSPFGLERRVTRSKGNILFEVDGKPALQLYKTYLGNRAQGLPATALLFPLSILDKTVDSSEGLMRTVLGIDEENQSLIFAGDIPSGSTVRFMLSTIDRLIEGASEAAGQLNIISKGPALVIAVSCVARRMVMGERTEEGAEAVLDTLPPGTPLLGFFSYGELSPVSTKSCLFQNQTMTLTLIQED